VPRALISVSDKRGVDVFAEGLVRLGWEIVSTGGTAGALMECGVPVTPVDEVTGFPEILGGRVKTLHPAVHGGLLARRDAPEHMQALKDHGIEPIDLVAVNLYPFRQTVARPRVTFEEAIEQIDIGGPSMLRSAAKNHDAVIPIVDPRDYDMVLGALKADSVDAEMRRKLAAKVFVHTSSYDVAIAEYLQRTDEPLPPVLEIALTRSAPLRYGENPQQAAALYVSQDARGIANMYQLHGKELSFNNILDMEGAVTSASPWRDRPACVIVKHTTPCGIAIGSSTREAFKRALATDPLSAFGSVVAFNTVVDQSTAREMADLFVEVVVAPRINPDAVEVFKEKKNIRVIELPFDAPAQLDFKRVQGGFLAQERFAFDPDETDWKMSTTREPTVEEWRDLRFAWAAVSSVKSNAILIARNEAAIGIGAGQMSRVDASFIAAHKATVAGHDTKGAVLASDAFFPFADGIEEAAKVGITAVIQPGGSKRDQEVIDAANEHGIAMVMTGKRQFRH
jgi:phosphoribosylaminoimidazolecarboxamide formyltransferase/IMP cyclohydrolase